MTIFATWLDHYIESWNSKSEALFAPLFADDIAYMYTPFHPVMYGKADALFYFREGMKRQDDIAINYEVLAETPEYGIARFHGSVRMVASGIVVRIDGVVKVHLTDDGRCTRLDEWWVSDSAWKGSVLPG